MTLFPDSLVQNHLGFSLHPVFSIWNMNKFLSLSSEREQRKAQGAPGGWEEAEAAEYGEKSENSFSTNSSSELTTDLATI